MLWKTVKYFFDIILLTNKQSENIISMAEAINSLLQGPDVILKRQKLVQFSMHSVSHNSIELRVDDYMRFHFNIFSAVQMVSILAGPF